MQDVSSFLAELGLERYTRLFVEHEIDLDDFADLTAEDLIELKLPIGPRRKILKALKSLDNPLNSAMVERRHLTVVFIDLVEFATISRKLDPEDLFEMIAQYQNTCTRVIESFGGKIAQYIGDGVLAFFGWPVTSETSTQNAIGASLAVAEQIAALAAADDRPLSVRIGVANGLVLVQQSALGTADAFGSTVNLASRLQGIATPGEVVVSERVRNMIHRRYICGALGAHNLKGFEDPVAAWRVESEHHSAERVMQGGVTAPLIGRATQLDALRAAWSGTKEPGSTVVCIRGDPGLGKSRLAAEFTNEIRHEGTVLSFFGAPDAGQTPLFPIREHISAASGFAAGDSNATRQEKLSGLISATGLDDALHAPLVAELCGFSAGPPPTADSPERRKAALFDALLGLIRFQTGGKRAVLLFEDLHWFDPTSREFVTFLANSAVDAPELLLTTARPYPELTAWVEELGPVFVDLDTLKGSDAEIIFNHQIGHVDHLDAKSAAALVARSDGVPLFIEELANSAKNDEFSGGIPDTLADLLMARLDKLGDAKEIALTAAVLDRDINEKLLSITTGKSEEHIRVSIERLVNERVLVPVPAFHTGSDRRGYLFRHALLREAAYENQLLRVRQQTHSRVADVFIGDEPDRVGFQPEIIAAHLAQAQRHKEAVGYYRQAGLRALGQAHYFEAETLFRNALDQLSRADSGLHTHNKTLEPEILTELGSALIAREGFGAHKVGETFEAAERIGREIGPGPALIRALWGSWLYCLVSGDLERANGLTVELNAFGEAIHADGDSNLLVEARFARGNTLFWQSDIAGSLEALRHAVDLYDPQEHANHALLFGQDPLVGTHCYLAYSNWACGRHSDSWASLRSAILHAQAIDHPFTTAWALCFPPMITSLRRETWAARRLSSVAKAHTGKQMLPFWHSAMTIVHGWAVAHQGDVTAGLAEAEAGLDMYIQTGSNTVQPYFRGLVAECLALAGEFDKADEMLEQAFAGARRSGERISENTLQIYAARLLKARGASADDIAGALHTAIDMARASGAVTIEIEAALMLCETEPGHAARDTLRDALSRAPQPGKTRDGRRAIRIIRS